MYEGPNGFGGVAKTEYLVDLLLVIGGFAMEYYAMRANHEDIYR